MRVLLVNRHFGNEQVPTARMAFDLAAEFVARDYKVTVVSAGSSYVRQGDDSTLKDIRLVRLVTPGENWRLLSWLAFLAQAAMLVPFLRWDRCIFMTDPPFQVVIAFWCRLLQNSKSKILFWTMDIYPEILVSTGMIAGDGIPNRLLRWLNNKALERIDGVVYLGECQRSVLSAYPSLTAKPYIVQPPWDNRRLASVVRDSNRFLDKYQLQGKKVALYAGNLGEGHVYAPVLQLARELERIAPSEWVFVFAVRGSKKTALMLESRGMPNILVVDYQPPDWSADLLWAADAHVITMSASSRGLVVPSKLYGALKTDAPVLFIGPDDSETAREIGRHTAGVTVAEDASLSQLVSAFAGLPGRSGRPAGDNMLRAEVAIADFVAR